MKKKYTKPIVSLFEVNLHHILQSSLDYLINGNPEDYNDNIL